MCSWKAKRGNPCPRSLTDPITTNATNISGFLNMLVAARDANILRREGATPTHTNHFRAKVA
jgi:hypothetical protein